MKIRVGCIALAVALAMTGCNLDAPGDDDASPGPDEASNTSGGAPTALSADDPAVPASIDNAAGIAGSAAGSTLPDNGMVAGLEPGGPDNGPALQRPIGDDGDLTPIAGVWDDSFDTGAGPDVRYFRIDADGTLTEYDYQLDAVGTGEDCHVVSTGSIATRGNDRYDISDSSSLPGSRSIDDVLITANGGSIVFRYLGAEPDALAANELGPGGAVMQTGMQVTYPAASGVQPELVQPCS